MQLRAARHPLDEARRDRIVAPLAQQALSDRRIEREPIFAALADERISIDPLRIGLAELFHHGDDFIGHPLAVILLGTTGDDYDSDRDAHRGTLRGARAIRGR
jgi:hypothetical protein